MRVLPSDERDCTWEDSAPVFRVYLFSGPGPSFSVDTFDIADSDVEDAISWAKDQAAQERQWSIALIRDSAPDGRAGRGLVWLAGRDLNDVPDDGDPRRRLPT